MVRILNLVRDSGAFVPVECPWQGVHVDHYLGDVGGAFDAGLAVNDEEVVAVGLDDEVGLPGGDGGAPLEAERILGLDLDGVAAVQEPVPGLGNRGSLLNLPLSEVQVGGLLFVALAVSFEPGGPLAGAFAGERLGQPGRPDVGEGTGCSRQVCDSRRWSLRIATSLSVGLV